MKSPNSEDRARRTRSVLDCSGKRSATPLWIRTTFGHGQNKNPNGIPSQNPGLRGTSYPGCRVEEEHHPKWVASPARRRYNPVGVAPGAPHLTIYHTTTNTVVVSWPSPSTDFLLQHNSSLSSTNWMAPVEAIADRHEQIHHRQSTSREPFLPPFQTMKRLTAVKPHFEMQGL